jgi:hypothetical protein
MSVYPFSVPSQIICSINDTTKVMIGRIEFAVFEDLIEFYKNEFSYIDLPVSGSSFLLGEKHSCLYNKPHVAAVCFHKIVSTTANSSRQSYKATQQPRSQLYSRISHLDNREVISTVV